MPTVIATISLKGGVGKTTLTAGLADFLAGVFGKKVLLVDLDAQTNLTTMMIGEKTWQACNARGHTVATLFADVLDGTRRFDLERTVQRGVSSIDGVAGIDLVPSSLDLIDLQEEMSAHRVVADDHLAAVGVLRGALAPAMSRYDYVLIDCPPNVGPFSLNGLFMASGYLLPTIPDVLSTYAIPRIQRQVADFGAEIGRTIVELGVVITKYRSSSSLHRDTVHRLRRDPTIQNILPAYLHEANAIGAAAAHTRWPSLHAKYGYHGHYEQFRDLTRAVMVEAGAKLLPIG
ncbi:MULTISPECIES: ParA family protein [Gordonia]|uniref:ParA family protein n=1 Tax=Gordonia amicalis TaxID=89053 RepID=A0AAE4R2E3_9ACTN|nr:MULTISPECIES: ParA family protein [Gordonia]MCR8896291.1 ParA family protein [Gordonia sp. GONU]MCZ4653651.1 ParA family protein [Gordonia amicalis]MDJ0451556.1 ParA family protein [Gordonia amicalis]MDV6311151.1 ParA family protein [Gordonia amicalis]MDV7075712.1 ParA family protein [Gordonia amicalis]